MSSCLVHAMMNHPQENGWAENALVLPVNMFIGGVIDWWVMYAAAEHSLCHVGISSCPLHDDPWSFSYLSVVGDSFTWKPLSALDMFNCSIVKLKHHTLRILMVSLRIFWMKSRSAFILVPLTISLNLYLGQGAFRTVLRCLELLRPLRSV